MLSRTHFGVEPKLFEEKNLEDHETSAEYILDILVEERKRLILIIPDKKAVNRDYLINRFIEVENNIFKYMDEIYE